MFVTINFFNTRFAYALENIIFAAFSTFLKRVFHHVHIEIPEIFLDILLDLCESFPKQSTNPKLDHPK